jgi:hypothetical protein
MEHASFTPIGFKALTEILVRGSYSSIGEIPFNFNKRAHEKSKMAA